MLGEPLGGPPRVPDTELLDAKHTTVCMGVRVGWKKRKDGGPGRIRVEAGQSLPHPLPCLASYPSH